MKADDPRRVQGEIVGPDDDPYGEENVVIDLSHALLLGSTNIALVGAVPKGGIKAEDRIALELQGRINQTDEHISVMVLLHADGAAALVTELIGVASRAGWREEFMRRVEDRWKEMPK